jgi:hypothetical protein
MPDDVRDRLEAAAHKNKRNVSDELVARLRSCFDKEREQDRDPALRALNFVIAQLAERVSGGLYVADGGLRLEQQKEWRTDPFKFRAFKFAVGKLLDALEPSGEMQSSFPEAEAKQSAQFFGYSPELEKLLIEIHKTPEACGAHAFGGLWTQLTRTNPLTEKEKEMARRYPRLGDVIEREFYGLGKARRDLGIDKSKSGKGD